MLFHQRRLNRHQGAGVFELQADQAGTGLTLLMAVMKPFLSQDAAQSWKTFLGRFPDLQEGPSPEILFPGPHERRGRFVPRCQTLRFSRDLLLAERVLKAPSSLPAQCHAYVTRS